MNYSITGWKEMYNKLLQEQQTQLESEKQKQARIIKKNH